MIDRKTLEEIGKKYFRAFEKQEIAVLNELFDDDIQLTDPFINKITGKKNVLAANSDTFSNVVEIKLLTCNLFVDINNYTIVGELNIVLDSTNLEVVDIIKVNDKLLITSITAYINPIKD
jgi:hypothetical protein